MKKTSTMNARKRLRTDAAETEVTAPLLADAYREGCLFAGDRPMTTADKNDFNSEDTDSDISNESSDLEQPRKETHAELVLSLNREL